MLTYTPAPPRPRSETREYPWALLLLVFAWLWPGVFSHDLWKPSEPALYTAISETAHGSPWLPTLFGKPYFSAAPIYIQTALLFQKLLSPWAADAYSAARFASVLFAAVGLLGCGMAGFRLLGRHNGRSVVLTLIGSAGLLPMTHFLDAQSVVFAGAGLMMGGYSVSDRQAVFSAFLTGLGAMLLAQSAGLAAAFAAFLAGALPLLCPQWRSRRALVSLLGGAVVALPLVAVYPLALSFAGKQAFALYAGHHLFGGFGGLHDFQAAFSLPYYAKQIAWFAFPALPLALWTLSRGKVVQSRAGVFAACWLAVFALFLSANPRRSQDLLVLLLPALALLGAADLDRLRHGAASFLNWFGIMVFGASALFLWIGFVAMNFGFPAKLAERAAYFSPYYTRDIDPMPIIVAAVFTPLWLVAIRRKNIRGRQAVTNWAAGTTLVWALLMTLFLPWIDAAKSYRPVVQQMQVRMPAQAFRAIASGESCLYIGPQFEDAVIAWRQYGALPFDTENTRCRYTLVQYNPTAQRQPENGARVLWEGSRPRNRRERFALLDTQKQP